MNIALTRLSTRALGGLAQRVVKSSKNGKFKIVEEHELLKALEKESKEFEDLYGKLTYSGKGNEIVAADVARDKTFTALRTLLKGYKELPLPNAADAAALYKVFEQYGTNVERMNYVAETAQMVVIFKELDKPENAARFEALKFKPAYEELKKRQNAFEDLYAVQAEANAELRKLPPATAARARLQKALTAYLHLLEAMKDLPTWDTLYLDINEMVKSAAATYRNDRSDKAPDDPNAPKEPKEPKKPRKPKDNDPDIRLPEVAVARRRSPNNPKRVAAERRRSICRKSKRTHTIRWLGAMAPPSPGHKHSSEARGGPLRRTVGLSPSRIPN